MIIIREVVVLIGNVIYLILIVKFNLFKFDLIVYLVIFIIDINIVNNQMKIVLVKSSHNKQ